MRRISFMMVALGAIVANAGAQLAADNASDAAYTSGWTVGSNGGYGFGSWTTIASYDSGPAPSIVNSSVLGGPAWEVGSDGSTYGGSYVTRVLGSATGGQLNTGQTLALDIYQPALTAVSGDASWGVDFLNASGQNVTSFFGYFYNLYGVTPTNDLFTASSSGNLDYGFSYGSGTGLHLALTVTGASTFSAAANAIGGSGGTETGSFQNAGPITAVEFFTYGSDSTVPLQVEDMSITATPEPTSMLAVAGFALLAVRRRRKS